MHQYSRVLVAVDLSQPARGAFDYALALAVQHGAELIVVQAVPLTERWRRRERSALTETQRQKAQAANVKLTTRIQQGDPAEIILLDAGSLNPDVLVVGSHQRSGIARLRQGSIAERIAAKSDVPVLAVPLQRKTSATTRFRHVAVAVDFGAASDEAMRQALTLTGSPTDRVTLLHVVPGLSPHVPPHLYGYGLATHRDPLMRDARQRLRGVLEGQPSTPVSLDGHVLLGDVSTELTRAVDSIGADLLVVGVPKRAAMSRALFGTTASRLLRVARVPILAVPAVGGARDHQESSALPLAG